MKRKIVMVTAIFLLLACVSALVYIEKANRISAEEAVTLMEEYLVSEKHFGPGLVERYDPQQTYYLESITETRILGKRAYSIDLRYGPGPMNGRLVFGCAVSKDGKDFFRYDQVTGNWEKMEP